MSGNDALDLWEPSGAGDHRRLSRRPGVLAAIEHLVQTDAYINGRLADVHMDDQRWGATGLHFSGVWRESGAAVLLKLGVGVNELFWMRWLTSQASGLVPTLFASGERLGPPPGHELSWIVTERVPFGPLGPPWQGDEFEMLLEAGVRFQKAARRAPSGHFREVDRAEVRHRLEQGLGHDPPGPAGQVLSRLDHDWEWVVKVCPPEICHGDLHLANALSRTPPPTSSQALLIDPAPAFQPWSFDAARAQILNSIDRGRAGYTHLVERMAALRETQGLATCRGIDLTRLAAISLGWFAIVVWGRAPWRHSNPDYISETRRYIEESVSL
jgi:hypothetical protein